MRFSLWLCIFLSFASQQPVTAQVVQGQVVDSLTRTPVAGAAVFLVDSNGRQVGETIADDQGLFLLRSPSGSELRLQVVHAEYRTSTFPPFRMDLDQTRSFMLLVALKLGAPEVTTDQLETMIEQACPGGRLDHPIVVGIIRDAATGGPAAGARVQFGWAALPDAMAQELGLPDVMGVAEADSLGRYAVCGVPRGSKISLHASTPDALSDFVRLEVVGNVVLRRGVSARMLGPFWVEDFTVRSYETRTTDLVGTVTDLGTGQPVADATVSLMGTDISTTTDSAGTFRLSHLPSGPVRLDVRKLGIEPLARDITLPEGRRLELPAGLLAVSSRTELSPITVEARPAPHPLAEFNERRRNGNGSFLTREEFMAMGNPTRATDVLVRMPGIRLEAGTDMRHRVTISMQRGGPRTFGFGGYGAMDGSNCPPLYFLDRQFIGTARTVDIDATISLMDVQAVEAHGSTATLPAIFNRRGAQCGVIAFWTQRAPPRTFAIDEDESFFSSTPFHFLLALTAVVAIFVGLGEGIHF